MRFDLTISLDPTASGLLGRLVSAFEALVRANNTTDTKLEMIMSDLTDLDTKTDAILAVATAANVRGDEIVALIQQLRAGGLTPEQQALVDSIAAKLEQTKSELDGITGDQAASV